MKYFHLLWRNLLRRKVRTTFTFLSIVVAFLLFVLVMGYGLLAVPQLRRRSAAEMQKSTKSWKLRPE